MPFKFGKMSSRLCSFCKKNDETPFHLFFKYTRTNHLFNELEPFCSNALFSLLLTPQIAILRMLNPLSANPTKRSNALRQFVGCC